MRRAVPGLAQLGGLVLVMVSLVGTLDAQGREPRDGRAVSSLAVSIYNHDLTKRVIGAYDVGADASVDGDVGVLNGPVKIGGRIRGSLVVINADVHLLSSAIIERDLIVVGGVVRRDDGATVRGNIRTQLELLQYTLDGDRIDTRGIFGDFGPTFGAPWRNEREEYTDLFFLAAGTYNRVEGLPIKIGPRFRRGTDWGRVQVEAFGVARTAQPHRWDRGSLGHDARAEIRIGRKNGLVITGNLFDVVAPIEDWQLTNAEAGISTFVMHRDLRDHYGRHGVEATLGGRLGDEASLVVALGSERWRSVTARNPITMLDDGFVWRANAPMDEGTVDLLGFRLNIDTRNRVRAPWTGGWFVKSDIERGRGTLARSPDIFSGPTAPEVVNYTRGFIDARRYNRISPGTAFNLRIVAGGWLAGDRLPLQRRLSMGGPGAVDGNDFRIVRDEPDVFTCGGIAERDGKATQCDRIALGQVELRQDFHVNWVRNDHEDDWWRPGFNGRGQWVLFADAGRGWTVNGGDAAFRVDRGLPQLDSFRTSLGTGLDFGEIGFYFSKSLTNKDEKVNFTIRMGRRF
jgi:hypothetical protein